MAIYSLIVSRISRSDGRSAIAAAAYRSGSRLHDKRTGQTFDYKRRKGITDSFITLPDHAPDWASDRLALWNEAETAEKRKNSTVAREFMVALPAELSPEQRRALVQRFACALVDIYGFAIDTAIHEPSKKGDDRNHHAHLLASPRVLTAEGFKEKTRVLDDSITGPKEIIKIRKMWANFANEALEKAQIDARIDHRSNVMLAADKKDEIEQLEKEATALEASASKINSFSDIKNGIKAVLPHLSALFVRNPVEKAAILREKIESLYNEVARLSLPILSHQGVVKTAIRRKEAARYEVERKSQELAQQKAIAAQEQARQIEEERRHRQALEKQRQREAAQQAEFARRRDEDSVRRELKRLFKAHGLEAYTRSSQENKIVEWYRMIEWMVDLHQHIDSEPLLLRSASIFSGIVSLIGDGSSAQGQALIKALQDAQLLQIEIKPIGSDNGYSKLIAWQMTIADDLAKNLYLDGNRESLEERENNLILAYFKARNNIDVPPLEAATVIDKSPKQLELKLEQSDDEDHDYSWNSGPSL